MQQINPIELSQWLNDAERESPILLDVRETGEYEICNIANSQLIPINTIPHRFAELDEDATIVVICHHGMRSYQVASFLERQGFANVINLNGGIARWAEEVDLAMAKY
ncbi:rhodanese-like domain-containing protein [Iodobacter sp. LRB]|uniref:rhodanese-like domain-containing protein n=1 Tax=unclassified Iodobacter TaxID=235634 RepID=UPI000C0F743C|nr:rhodanese-like domain-containing protein [Iodobacter sp. BJB302]PHV03462.1 sulfurtransferase [Iodobacter sp. BJB302]